MQKNTFSTLWVPSTKMSCCMPRCGNGDSLTSTRSCLTKLHRCCERWSEKDGCNCPIKIGKKFKFYCRENTICQKNAQIWTSKFRAFRVTTIVASLWQNTHFFVNLYFHEHGFRSVLSHCPYFNYEYCYVSTNI